MVEAGGEHTCALTDGGVTYCWGANSEGQVGYGFVADQLTPRRVTESLTFQTVAAGERHSCAVAQGGTVYCWGDNFAGQLGIGRAGLPISEPQIVAFPGNSP
jgi:alpha-tubulin suppressor-like RCC1 family protein